MLYVEFDMRANPFHLWVCISTNLRNVLLHNRTVLELLVILPAIQFPVPSANMGVLEYTNHGDLSFHACGDTITAPGRMAGMAHSTNLNGSVNQG